MSRSKRRKSGAPLSIPPESTHIDASWDELVASVGEEKDASERTTAIPAVPAETYAKHVMAEAERAERPTDPGKGAAACDEFASVLPPLPSEPPLVEVKEPKRSISTVPPPGASKATRRQRAVTRRDQPAARRRSDAPTSKRGGRKKSPPDAANLELAPISDRPAPRTVPAKGKPSGTELKDRYAMGDFTGALVIAESILEKDPDDIDAQRYAQACREVLMQMYSERMGSLRKVASVAIPSDQIRWLSLDHRSGFMLSLVDGTSTIEEILDICGMPRLDALRILYTLLEQRVIALSGS